MGYCCCKEDHKLSGSLNISKGPDSRLNTVSPIVIPYEPNSSHNGCPDCVPQPNSLRGKLQKYFPSVDKDQNQFQLRLNADTSNGIDSGRTDFNDLNVLSPHQNNLKCQSPHSKDLFFEYSHIFEGNYPLSTAPSPSKLKSQR